MLTDYKISFPKVVLFLKIIFEILKLLKVEVTPPRYVNPCQWEINQIDEIQRGFLTSLYI